MRLNPLLPAIALLALAAACSRQEPQPQPAAEPAASSTTSPDPATEPHSRSVEITSTMTGPTTEPAAAASPIAPVRPPSASELERIRSDGTGLSATLACQLLPRERIDAYARARREELLSAGVDAAAYDAAYAGAFDTVQTKYPQVAADKQKQICVHAKAFETTVREQERSVAGHA